MIIYASPEYIPLPQRRVYIEPCSVTSRWQGGGHNYSRPARRVVCRDANGIELHAGNRVQQIGFGKLTGTVTTVRNRFVSWVPSFRDCPRSAWGYSLVKIA
jgi:hypothetical protein